MNPEIKAMWLDALPRYQQSMDRLQAAVCLSLGEVFEVAPLPFAPRDYPDDSMTLAKANDAGCSFAQIADLIRAFL
jgi:hypothetical protein